MAEVRVAIVEDEPPARAKLRRMLGAHAGYRVYACADGRVAVAALEPHFAQRLCQAVGVPGADTPQAALALMFRSATHHAVAEYFAGQTRAELDRLAAAQDIPLHTLAPEEGSE